MGKWCGGPTPNGLDYANRKRFWLKRHSLATGILSSISGFLISISGRHFCSAEDSLRLPRWLHSTVFSSFYFNFFTYFSLSLRHCVKSIMQIESSWAQIMIVIFYAFTLFVIAFSCEEETWDPSPRNGGARASASERETGIVNCYSEIIVFEFIFGHAHKQQSLHPLATAILEWLFQFPSFSSHSFIGIVI